MQGRAESPMVSTAQGVALGYGRVAPSGRIRDTQRDLCIDSDKLPLSPFAKSYN